MTTFKLKHLEENYIFLRQNSFLDIFFPIGINVINEVGSEVYYKFKYTVKGYVISETNGTPELKYGCVNNIIDYSDLTTDVLDGIEFDINRHLEKYLQHKKQFNFKHLFKYDNESKHLAEIGKQIKLKAKIHNLCVVRRAFQEKN